MKFTLVSEDSVNKLLQQCLNRGQWSKAAEQYRKLIKLHPENINLQLRMAEVCVKGGNKKEALEQYLVVAEHHISMKNLPKGVSILRTMLNIDSGLSHIRIKLAELYAMLGDTQEMWSQYITTFKYLEEKKLVAQSIAVLERMAKLRLEDSKLMLKLAEMFMARNLFPQAANQFLSVAELFLQEGESKAAAKCYKQVLSLDSDNIEAQKGLEVLRYIKDKAPAPIASETEESSPPSQAPPKKPPAPKSAEDRLNALLAQVVNQPPMKEDDLGSHYNLGRVYQEMVLLDAAIEEFTQAAVDSNLQRQCYQSLSKCFKQKGMERQAQKYQQMYLNLGLSQQAQAEDS